MHRFKIMMVALVSIVLLSSCSSKLSPFTDNIYQELGGDNNELSKVQFYLSNDIVLYRDFGGQKSKVENGTIKLIDGRKIEEVVFKKGTPGVFLFSPKRDRVAIGFDSGDDAYLMFGPNAKAGGRFVLLAKEWKNRRGKVTYAGEVWNTTSESSYANLMVDLDRARNTKYKKKTASGRKVN